MSVGWTIGLCCVAVTNIIQVFLINNLNEEIEKLQKRVATLEMKL